MLCLDDGMRIFAPEPNATRQTQDGGISRFPGRAVVQPAPAVRNDDVGESQATASTVSANASKAASNASVELASETVSGVTSSDTSNAGPKTAASVTGIFVLLFLAFNFLFLITSSGRVRTRDELSVDLQAESLALRGSTATPQAPEFYFYGKLDRAGQPQPPYGALHAALVVPWYAAGRVLRAVVPGIPPGAQDVVMDAAVVASSATFAALAAALVFLALFRLGIPRVTAVWVACVVGLSTPLFSYASWLYSEPLSAAIFLAAAVVLFTGARDRAVSSVQASLAGLLLGLALWVRPTHLIAVPVFLTALLVRDREKAWGAIVRVCLIVGVFGAAYLLRNQHFFGNPFDFGYPTVSDGGKNLNSFHTPLLTGLYGLLFSPGKSVFLFAPVILLALFGLRKLARLDRGLAVVAAGMPLVYLLFYARYTQWEGGFCVGPRYLLPAIPLLCLGLGPMLRDGGPWLRRSLLVLFLIGLGVQGITSATSYLEDQANGNYYDQAYNYRMDYAPLVSMTRQLAHYAATPSDTVPLGLGFDRWFVFLPKAGVARGTVFVFLGAELAGFLVFTGLLATSLRTRPLSVG